MLGYLQRKFFLDNLSWFNPEECEGKYQMPIIKKTQEYPLELIRFSDIGSAQNHNVGIHFFLDDYRFECIWRNTHKYIPKLSLFSFVLSPDFSLYLDMSLSQQIWNVYRSRLLGYAMQKNGLKIIPTLSWSGKESFDFCFDGIEQGGIVGISTVGTWHSSQSRSLFLTGLSTLIERISPSGILLYGKIPEFDFKNISIYHFPACRTGRSMLCYKEEK